MRWGIAAAIALIVACGGPVAVGSTPEVATNVRQTSPSPLGSPIASGKCHERDGLPDPACTPGATDPRVTQANIATTICASGYAKTVRPPASYTEPLKVQGIRDYGYADTNPADYEEDHLISLELGGAPRDPRNLWPESGRAPNPKDAVENRLHREVCAGSITLDAAQHAIATNWKTA